MTPESNVKKLWPLINTESSDAFPPESSDPFPPESSEPTPSPPFPKIDLNTVFDAILTGRQLQITVFVCESDGKYLFSKVEFYTICEWQR